MSESSFEGKLFGNHMDKPVVAEKVCSLIDQRTYYDMQCYLIVSRLLEYICPDTDNTRELSIAKEAKALIKSRSDVNDLMMKIIAGDEDTLKKEGLNE